MIGPTHAIGGAAAYALYVGATGQADEAPIWAFGLAALAGLVPDADNGRGSLLNRLPLRPIKWATLPLWYGASHRGRTHSIIGVALFGLIMLGWGTLLAALARANGGSFVLEPWITASILGYASHLVIDILNIPGLLLLWPLPIRFYFPPWRWTGPLPGRIPTSNSAGTGGTWQERILLWGLIAAALMNTLITHGDEIARATAADKNWQAIARIVGSLIGAIARAIGDLITGT